MRAWVRLVRWSLCAALALGVACEQQCRPRAVQRDAAVSVPREKSDPEPEVVAYGVRFEPAPGAFTQLPSVSLQPASREVQLYYTLDGTLPDEHSTLYSGPIPLHATTLVRVASYRDGQAVQYASGSYIELAEDVAEFSSNLPLMIIHMLGGSAPTAAMDVHLPGVIQVRTPDSSGRTRLAGDAAQLARVGIKRHGRRTRNQAKPSFNLELRGEQSDDDDEKARLLDMPAQSDWVLYAPYELDRAILRNSLFYELSRSIGRYAARTRFIEVFLADSGQRVDASRYLGVYVAIESVKRDKRRVAIERLSRDQTELPAIAGGYLMRADEADPGERHYPIVNHPRDMVLRYPKRENLNQEQERYILDYLNACGRAAGAPDRIDPETHQSLFDLIDRDSFIDIHLLNLFAKNSDAWRLSAYYYKPRNEKLKAGPVWDCDRCMGSYDGRSIDPHGWLATGSTVDYFAWGWWGGIFSDPAFEERYWSRLEELLQGPLDTEAVLAKVDALADQLDEAASRNAARHPAAAPVDGSFRTEVNNLRDWLSARITWMKANLRKR